MIDYENLVTIVRAPDGHYIAWRVVGANGFVVGEAATLEVAEAVLAQYKVACNAVVHAAGVLGDDPQNVARNITSILYEEPDPIAPITSNEVH